MEIAVRTYTSNNSSSNGDEQKQEQRHHRYALRERSMNQRLSSEDEYNSKSNNSNNNQSHIDYEMTEKWAAFYPNENVAVVTRGSKPPLPPNGYVPLRIGHERQSNNANDENEPPVGFSLDTLLWNEKLLEDRLTELNAWTRRSPPTQRQKLDRINSLINRCNNN